MFKKLMGGFTDESWPDTGTSVFGETCSGHKKGDVIPLEGVLEGLEEGQQLTNGEVYDAMDPQSSSLPYIYDDFSWSHCLDYSIDFSQVVIGETIDDA